MDIYCVYYNNVYCYKQYNMAEITENKEQLSTTIARHYDNGENSLSARNESRILYLRNFNNWVKSTLIR